MTKGTVRYIFTSLAGHGFSNQNEVEKLKMNSGCMFILFDENIIIFIIIIIMHDQ